MLRVKDIEKSLKFYQEVLGMKLVRTHEAEAAGFNLYFLGYPGKDDTSSAGAESTANREGLLELTWNYGTEKDENFKYHSGNEDPQGFGHICKCYSLVTTEPVLFSESCADPGPRCNRGRYQCRVPEVRGPAVQLEKEAHGWSHEGDCLPPRPGWILGRDCC